ncbi:MAG TPA: ATP-binding protein [Caulobacteraceae bacterium]|nr:ATP-binding protein [Caulobacteraceae bacterium]
MKTDSDAAALASIAGLPLPMAFLDETNTILEATPAFAALLGQDAASLGGLEVNTLLACSAAESASDAHRIELGASSRWLRLDVFHGKVRTAVLTDITVERRASLDLAAWYAHRDALLNDAAIGAWRFDPDTETYQFSHALALGYESAAKPVPLEALQSIQHKEDRAADAEIRERLTREGGAAEAEMRYLDGKGGWQHLRVLYRSGKQLPSGKYEMYGLSQTVTALAKTRDEARFNAQRLKLALTAAKAGVFEHDYRHNINWFSQEVEELVGSEAVERAKADPLSAYHPDDQPVMFELFKKQGAADPVDVRVVRADGTHWIRVYWQVELDIEGKPRRGVGLALDIDEQKRQALALEEAHRAAEQATASKSNFLASVSHEIRTPMNGIVGVLHLLERENLSEEGRDMLAEALSCSDMLAQLINDVLDFSKMEAGKLEITPVPTEPAAVLESVVALLHPQADAKNLYLCMSGEAAGWAMVDPVRLRQCLFNTIGNAIKFTTMGGVEVRMSYVGEGTERQLRCEIQDTGIGVPEAAKAALFDRFQQGDEGTTRKFGGTGLGLAISRSLARMMGGDMDFDSQSGRGSTFWFEIAAPPTEAPAARPAAIQAAPLVGLRVLLVDDNRTNRLVGLKALEALGASAETVESGEAALLTLSRDPFDLVLMDINMPGMDGMEAARRIRDLPGDAASVAIVALTADVMTHHQQAYYAAGMNGFVPKPFSPADLLTEIARLAS